MTFEFCEKVDWLIYGIVGKATKVRVQSSQISEKCISFDKFCGAENKMRFWSYSLSGFTSRVAKCHEYEEYIRVKIFAGWGKKSWRRCNLAKFSPFWEDLHNYARFMCRN